METVKFTADLPAESHQCWRIFRERFRSGIHAPTPYYRNIIQKKLITRNSGEARQTWGGGWQTGTLKRNDSFIRASRGLAGKERAKECAIRGPGNGKIRDSQVFRIGKLDRWEVIEIQLA